MESSSRSRHRHTSRALRIWGTWLCSGVVGGCGGPAAGDGAATTETQSPPAPLPPGAPPPAFATLKEAGAAAQRLVGVALNESPLSSDDSYRRIAAQEFDYVTAENAMKWQPLQPSSAEVYSWDNADAIVQFAQDGEQAIKGHTFVWYMQNPDWAAELTAEELRTAMQNHIRTTMTRYAGKVRAWDIVNESVDVDASTGYKENIFWEKLGPGYVEEAFVYADQVRQEVDPDTLLFYNEIGIERIGPKSDFAYRMLKDLVAKGVPIDGIGFQSHVSTHRYPSEADLRANLRRFAELGISVNISEVDVRDTVLQGSPQSRALAQRIAYQQIVAACVQEPACEAITFWGFTDNYSWLLDEGDFSPLLFDNDYQKKPAYLGVLDGLAGKLPVRGANLLANPAFAEGVTAWTASGGTLAVATATDREGNVACLDGRTGAADGLVQTDLLSQTPSGAPMSFSAWVRADADGTVDASLLLEESGQTATESNIATIEVQANTWTLLNGYLGVGFAGTPASLGLKLHGPAANVQLCVADVALQPLGVE
jgi:endo-1,4-beta-xylanase